MNFEQYAIRVFIKKRREYEVKPRYFGRAIVGQERGRLEICAGAETRLEGDVYSVLGKIVMDTYRSRRETACCKKVLR